MELKKVMKSGWKAMTTKDIKKAESLTPQITNTMKKYNFYYYGCAITRAQFNKNVPKQWENDVTNGTYSYGGYRATEIY